MTDHRREIWIDWLRVTACFLVMMTHACEPFYLGGEGSLILTESDALWVSFLNVLPRACVALFVVASSYLQFPLHYSTGEFGVFSGISQKTMTADELCGLYGIELTNGFPLFQPEHIGWL